MNQENKTGGAPPGHIVFTRIMPGNRQHLTDVFNIYSASFPANERQPLPVLEERIKSGQNQVYVGREGTETVFIALLWPLQGTDFILLDYMATAPELRGRQIGSAFLQQIRAELEHTRKRLILEVEDPAFGDNPEQRQKRLQFYRKNGALVLSGLQYILPALDGSIPTEMLLMIFPGKPGEKMNAPLVRDLIARIYRELYGADAAELLRKNDLYNTGKIFFLK